MLFIHLVVIAAEQLPYCHCHFCSYFTPSVGYHYRVSTNPA